MADIVIINPRFESSFWGMEDAVGLMGKRANLPVSCLPLLAALVPDGHDVTVIDENVEDVDYERLGRADLVCITGMSIQFNRMCEILAEARSRGTMTAVGGAHATVMEHDFDGLTDVLFVGEADETWPQFINDWQAGRKYETRYVQENKTDMSTLPTPRLDLLKAKEYMFGSMQISRGCPFTCEFCDIIVTFGRRPRLKESAQVLRELDTMVEAGFQIVFVVDDNFIGNKKAIKPIIQDMIDWQEANAYPLTLFTEASLDLAEDPELMEMMGKANFQSVFVGIESPNEEALKETKKLQNVRPRDGTIYDRIRRIQDAGLEVWCGMILGFDNDDKSSFHTMPDFLHETRIGNALIGILYAIPTTPLYARLKKDGRLNNMEDTKRFGTNVVPVGMSREELRDGFVKVMTDVYDRDAYFDRIDKLFLDDRFQYAVHNLPYWKENKLVWAKRCAGNWVKFLYVFNRLMKKVEDEELRNEYRRRMRRVMRARYKEPHILFIYSIKVAMHYHFRNLSEMMAEEWEETREVIMDRAA